MQRRLERGTTGDSLDELIAAFKHDHGLVFTVDTLEFLARGGRIGRAQAWAGELLSVKPILTITDGEIVPVKRVRGSKKAFGEFQRMFEERTSDSPSLRVGIAHADAPDREEALRRMVKASGRARDRGLRHARPRRRHPPARARSGSFSDAE
jgi:DegV family protein with EDD domain